jgi:hypothetical protein
MGEVIFKGNAMAYYGQVMLIDAEDKESYPEWVTGSEIAVLGPKGVAVSVLLDALVEILVVQGDSHFEGILYNSGEIMIGNCGIIVGNEIAAMSYRIAWPSGRTKVNVYANDQAGKATQVIFALEHISS